MNRPWSIVVIAVFTILLIIAGIVENLEDRILIQEGYMDPEHLLYATSFVHRGLLVLQGIFALTATFLLYFLRREARLFYLGVVSAEAVNVVYFYLTTNAVNLDLGIFIFIALLLYSQRLFQLGLLK